MMMPMRAAASSPNTLAPQLFQGRFLEMSLCEAVPVDKDEGKGRTPCSLAANLPTKKKGFFVGMFHTLVSFLWAESTKDKNSL